MAKVTVEGMCQNYDRFQGRCNALKNEALNASPDQLPLIASNKPSKSFVRTPDDWYREGSPQPSYVIFQLRCGVGTADGHISNEIALKQKACSQYVEGPPIRKRTKIRSQIPQK